MPLGNENGEPVSIGQGLTYGLSRGAGTGLGILGGGNLGARLGSYLGQNAAASASYRDILRNRHVDRGTHLVGAGMLDKLKSKALDAKDYKTFMGMDAPGLIDKLRNTPIPGDMLNGPSAGGPSSLRDIALPGAGGPTPDPKSVFENISRNANKLGLGKYKAQAKYFNMWGPRLKHVWRRAAGGAIGSGLGGIAGMLAGGYAGQQAGSGLGARLAGLSKTSSALGCATAAVAMAEKQAIVGLMQGIGQAAQTGMKAMGRMAGGGPTLRAGIQAAQAPQFMNQIAHTAAPMGRWANPVAGKIAPALTQQAPGIGQTLGTMAKQVGSGIQSDMSAMGSGAARVAGYGLPIAGAGYLAAQQGQPAQPQIAEQTQPLPIPQKRPITQFASTGIDPEEGGANPAASEGSLVAGGH